KNSVQPNEAPGWPEFTACTIRKISLRTWVQVSLSWSIESFSIWKQLFKYLRCMFFGVYLGNDVFDQAIFVNDKSGSCCAHILAPKHLFFNSSTVFFMNGEILVHQQGEGQGTFSRIHLMGLLGVGTDPEYHISRCQQAVVVIPKVTSLSRTSRCIVFRIEV